MLSDNMRRALGARSEQSTSSGFHRARGLRLLADSLPSRKLNALEIAGVQAVNSLGPITGTSNFSMIWNPAGSGFYYFPLGSVLPVNTACVGFFIDIRGNTGNYSTGQNLVVRTRAGNVVKGVNSSVIMEQTWVMGQVVDTVTLGSLIATSLGGRAFLTPIVNLPVAYSNQPNNWGFPIAYVIGAQVLWGGYLYACISNHTSGAGTDPTAAPTLWAAAPSSSYVGLTIEIEGLPYSNTFGIPTVTPMYRDLYRTSDFLNNTLLDSVESGSHN